jgi:Ser-Thr-rich glycosyl-phosphatidyl-inositol-anchored membrane family protein
MLATHLARHLRSHVVIALAAALLALPRIASAQPFAFQIPAGGETWTAGTTHTIEWTGGPVGVNSNVYLISITPFASQGPIVLNSPYFQPASWAISSGLTPGQYQLYIEDVGSTTYNYSQIFTVQARPTCASGCAAISVAPENFAGYPAVHCGSTAAIAMANAQSWLNAQLAAACGSGLTLDNSSVVADYTFLPTGSCYAGEFGAYMVEVSAVACCCSAATPNRRDSWGKLKVRYR